MDQDPPKPSEEAPLAAAPAPRRIAPEHVVEAAPPDPAFAVPERAEGEPAVPMGVASSTSASPSSAFRVPRHSGKGLMAMLASGGSRTAVTDREVVHVMSQASVSSAMETGVKAAVEAALKAAPAPQIHIEGIGKLVEGLNACVDGIKLVMGRVNLMDERISMAVKGTADISTMLNGKIASLEEELDTAFEANNDHLLEEGRHEEQMKRARENGHREGFEAGMNEALSKAKANDQKARRALKTETDRLKEDIKRLEAENEALKARYKKGGDLPRAAAVAAKARPHPAVSVHSSDSEYEPSAAAAASYDRPSTSASAAAAAEACPPLRPPRAPTGGPGQVPPGRELVSDGGGGDWQARARGAGL